jgi:hypothetical protein
MAEHRLDRRGCRCRQRRLHGREEKDEGRKDAWHRLLSECDMSRSSIVAGTQIANLRRRVDATVCRLTICTYL